MLIGSMVYYKIHNDTDIPFMSFCQHLVKIFHRTEFIHDRLIVADIISVIIVRRLINRRKPDNIDPQIF